MDFLYRTATLFLHVSNFFVFLLLFGYTFIFINVYVYRKTSNMRRTLVGNKIVNHSDVVGASPVGAAPTTSSFST